MNPQNTQCIIQPDHQSFIRLSTVCPDSPTRLPESPELESIHAANVEGEEHGREIDPRGELFLPPRFERQAIEEACMNLMPPNNQRKAAR